MTTHTRDQVVTTLPITLQGVDQTLLKLADFPLTESGYCLSLAGEWGAYELPDK